MSLSPDERTDLVVSWRETAWTPILTSRASEEEEEEGESGPGRKRERARQTHESHRVRAGASFDRQDKTVRG